jgi:response regulator NasT
MLTSRETMTEQRKPLRILIANERKDRLERIATIVTGLGHEVISRELEVADVAAATEREHPDLAFVGLGISGEHALDMISEIVREASCPVIALLESDDPVWVNEAAKRGIFAYIVDGRAEEMQSTIDITLRRYTEYSNLEGAFARRAVIERAKGIMMARQSIDENRAFELMRSQSQRSGQKLFDIAKAVVDSHLLLVPPERTMP